MYVERGIVATTYVPLHESDVVLSELKLLWGYFFIQTKSVMESALFGFHPTFNPDVFVLMGPYWDELVST